VVVGCVKAALTLDHRRPDRPPVCRIRAKGPAVAIMRAMYVQFTDVIAAGECIHLKWFKCGFESRRGHPPKLRSLVAWARPGEPVDEDRREQIGSLVHQRVACVLDNREGGLRIAFEQVGGVGVPDDGVASSGRDQGR
jgi:hypothetical protein